MISQSENNLQAQIRAEPADVEVNGPSLSIRRDHETRVVVSPPFVMDTSNTEQ